MSTPTVLVIAAMRSETRALRRRLRDRRQERWCGLASWTGRLEGREHKAIRVVHCGIGRVASERFAQNILDGPGVDLGSVTVLIIGLAGGLDPELERVALVEVTHVVDGASVSKCVADTRIDLQTGSQPEAVLLTADTLLAEPASKQAAWRRVDCAPKATVDMETFHLVTALRKRTTSIRCARAVSDTAETRLPPALQGDSGPPPLRLLGSILKQPSQIRELLRLGRTSGQCAERLADWVELVS